MIQNYTITNSRIKRAALYGFTRMPDGVVKLADGDTHFMILPCFNSFEEKKHWGRFHLKAELSAGCRIKIYAFARDAATSEEKEKVDRLNSFFSKEEVPLSEKRDIFSRAEGICGMDQTDMLFYELEGQYLWIAVEVTGCGEGKIWDMKLFNPGDNFMQTFPEIYREEGGFFHRYMSIFSSLYTDVQREIDDAALLLDPDQAPTHMLLVLAGWLGICAEEGYLDEDVLRKLIKKGYQLNRMKGTRWAIEELARIVLGEDVQIIERNLLEDSDGEMELYRRLYGDSPWDVTILANKAPEEHLQEQFRYLLAQYKPARCKVHLAFHQKCNTLDSYCYLDENAKLMQSTYGSLEQGDTLDGGVILK